MDFCDNSTRAFFEQLQNDANRDDIDSALELYKFFCPALIGGSLISVLINAALYAVGRSSSATKSPVLILSLNLASTDTIASLLVGLSIVCNAYLPVVFGVHLNRYPFFIY